MRGLIAVVALLAAWAAWAAADASPDGFGYRSSGQGLPEAVLPDATLWQGLGFTHITWGQRRRDIAPASENCAPGTGAPAKGGCGRGPRNFGH